MTTSLFSPVWYRAADLKPRWRLHVRVDRQVSRGEVWHVLSNAVGARSSRLDALAYAVVGRCDGRTRLDDIWKTLLEKDPDRAPTQDEVLVVVSQLVSDGFLECDRWPDIGRLLHEDERAVSTRRTAKLNPLSMRIALGNPSRVLRRQTRWAHRLFSPAGLFVWLCLVGFALTQLAAHYDDVRRHAALWMDTPRYWLLSWLCFAPVKFVHEWAHALAVRRWGGQVREMGVGILMFFPAPYVDASDANRFSSGRRRALVSAAGILAELALAAVGLLVWLNTEAGWVRDIAFSVALIGSVSTLMFNANPLMRMDGYFVLSDWAQLPNLAARSAQYWTHRIQASLLGVAPARPMRIAPGERKWLIGYAPAAWTYRVSVSLWLIVWAGEIHRWLAFAAVAATLLWLLVVPIARLLVQAQQSATTYRQRVVAPIRLGAALTFALALVIVMPLPDTRVAEGVVWMHEDSQIRAPIEGFVARWQADARATVRAADAVVELDDPVLRADRQRVEQRRPGLQAELYASLRNEPARSRQVQEQIAALDAELERLDERLAQLRVPAGAEGELGVARPEDQIGRFVRQGEILGVIQGARPPIVRVALDQDEAARISQNARSVSVRLAEYPGQALSARLVRQQPAAVQKLPSAALAEGNGGTIQIDPADKDGTRPAFPTFVLDVELPEPAHGEPTPSLGGRAWVRFEFGSAPLWSQLARAMRQTIRVRFASDTV